MAHKAAIACRPGRLRHFHQVSGTSARRKIFPIGTQADRLQVLTSSTGPFVRFPQVRSFASSDPCIQHNFLATTSPNFSCIRFVIAPVAINMGANHQRGKKYGLFFRSSHAYAVVVAARLHPVAFNFVWSGCSCATAAAARWGLRLRLRILTRHLPGKPRPAARCWANSENFLTRRATVLIPRPTPWRQTVWRMWCTSPPIWPR